MQREGKALTVALSGRLDSSTAPDLEKQLDLTDTDKLVFDLAGLEYISSAGLRILLASMKVMDRQGEMTVRHVQPAVMELFTVTGFNKILTIEPEEE
ncbi:MAG: STAS domain-containing protein [Erysipelotrichaceae bacterium]|nr:STAS domain-containing protein [Erysipelotrichaceae bacterium]